MKQYMHLIMLQPAYVNYDRVMKKKQIHAFNIEEETIHAFNNLIMSIMIE